MIESFKNTKFHLDIVGEGSQKNLLMKIANQNNVNLNILNNVENENLLDIIKNYKYFISTSALKEIQKVYSKHCLLVVL